ELYEVPAVGGRPMQVLTTPAENVRTSKDGRYLVYEDRKGGENQWRKHHTSAIARDLWIYDTKTGEHRQITTFAGEDRNPVLADGDKAIYYLSEESGNFNVHKVAIPFGPNGELRPEARGAEGRSPAVKSQQVTSFKTVPVRFLSMSDNGTL